MSTTEPPDHQQLKAALKAFKKKLKVLRLDEESGLTRSPLTSGRAADIVAIRPPDQFPQAVWDELVRQGKLKTNKYGTYEMVPE